MSRMFGTHTRRRPQPVIQTDVAVRKHRPDYALALLAVMLLALGFVVVYAISPSIAASRGVSEQYLVSKQIIAIALGLASFFVMSVIPYNIWKRFLKILVVAAVIMTLIALLTPVNAQYPAHRWVRFSGLSFQTAEFVKLTLLIWAAHFFAQRAARAELTNNEKTVKPTLMVIVALGIGIAGLQSDLGSAAVMVAIIVVVAYLDRTAAKVLLAGLAGVLGAGGAVVGELARIDRPAFVDPAQAPGVRAVGRGGPAAGGLMGDVGEERRQLALAIVRGALLGKVRERRSRVHKCAIGVKASLAGSGGAVQKHLLEQGLRDQRLHRSAAGG